MDAVWSLNDVTFQYAHAQRHTLDDVTLRIAAGRFTALLGPNGAGKSTLLQVLLGTLVPDGGATHFRGQPLASWTRNALARAVGVVPQEETEPPFSVRDIVAMGRYPYLGAWQRERPVDADAIARAMERCAILPLASRRFATLSVGERQRVRLARALAQEADVLVLDEPTTSLDVRHEMATFELLRALRGEGVTIVAATHNLNLAARYADELVLLCGGRLVAHGSPAAVLTAERVGDVYEWPVSIVPFGDGTRPNIPQVVPLDSFGVAPFNARSNAHSSVRAEVRDGAGAGEPAARRVV